MHFALFTPNGLVWPVRRNFEAFLLSLGHALNDTPPVRRLGQRSYAALPQESPELSAAADRRLQKLHRELYTALLRPGAFFAGHPGSLGDAFWPDLRTTAFDEQLDALCFYFSGYPAGQLCVVDGLEVLRSAFFNHEESAAELWLESAAERLTKVRQQLPFHSVQVELESDLRLNDLAFAAIADLDRSQSGPAWIRGSVKRSIEGRLLLRCGCYLDPETQAATADRAANAALTAQLTVPIIDLLAPTRPQVHA